MEGATFRRGDGHTPVEGQVRFTRTDGSVLVEAALALEVEEVCGRCLAPFRQTLSVDLREEFWPEYDPLSRQHVEAPEGREGFPIPRRLARLARGASAICGDGAADAADLPSGVRRSGGYLDEGRARGAAARSSLGGAGRTARGTPLSCASQGARRCGEGRFHGAVAKAEIRENSAAPAPPASGAAPGDPDHLPHVLVAHGLAPSLLHVRAVSGAPGPGDGRVAGCQRRMRRRR